MRRAPDKDTIINLKEQGLTLAEIGKRYGVTGAGISWALNYTPAPPRPRREPEPPKELKVPRPPCPIPLHVINHWRTEWGWSENKINQTILRYNQSLLERNGDKPCGSPKGDTVRPTRQAQPLPEPQPDRRRAMRELFLRTKARVEK